MTSVVYIARRKVPMKIRRLSHTFLGSGQSTTNLTLIGKPFPGNELDRITGKLIQSLILEFWGMTQAVLLENSSKTNHLVKK